MAKPVTLRIMEIQRFALHDGPGIRTTVFLKGCPLKCPWCANPESCSTEKQLMHFSNKCVSCGECIKTCASGAIKAAENPGSEIFGRPVFARNSCTACENCAKRCPKEAIVFSGMDISPEDILDEVMKDSEYYKHTGGGLTVSGGEPFKQADALNTLLSLAGNKGLHTAVETCGHVKPSDFKSSLENIDLLLFDLKHDNAEILKKVTAGDLNLILDNLTCAVKSGREVITRIPVIPGFNCDQKTLTGLLKLAQQNGVSEAHLLPFHLLGKNKYEQLGIPYIWDYTSLDKDQVRSILGNTDSLAIKIKIF